MFLNELVDLVSSQPSLYIESFALATVVKIYEGVGVHRDIYIYIHTSTLYTLNKKDDVNVIAGASSGLFLFWLLLFF